MKVTGYISKVHCGPCSDAGFDDGAGNGRADTADLFAY